MFTRLSWKFFFQYAHIKNSNRYTFVMPYSKHVKHVRMSKKKNDLTVQHMVLTIGTDCSGIEAPIQALKNLGIDFKHLFSSEIDASCIETIQANAQPDILYDADIRERDNTNTPKVDLYVCGFPCQPFSEAGSKGGFEDTRGTVFFGCVDYIQKRRPKFFVLENVRGLLTNNNGETWKTIMKAFESLSEYSIKWAMLDTKDFGIPQSRNRLYIVGNRSNKPFEFPHKQVNCPSQESFVDKTDWCTPEPRGTFLQRANDMQSTLKQRGACFVDILQYRGRAKIPMRGFKYSTCLLCTSYVWNTSMKRWANEKELLRLQGYPDDFKIVVPKHKFRRQIGNTMSVNVLEAIFARLFDVEDRLPSKRKPYTLN
jgi:DNA (cytosine-5)-methyltransferase 1